MRLRTEPARGQTIVAQNAVTIPNANHAPRERVKQSAPVKSAIKIAARLSHSARPTGTAAAK